MERIISRSSFWSSSLWGLSLWIALTGVASAAGRSYSPVAECRFSSLEKGEERECKAVAWVCMDVVSGEACSNALEVDCDDDRDGFGDSFKGSWTPGYEPNPVKYLIHGVGTGAPEIVIVPRGDGTNSSTLSWRGAPLHGECKLKYGFRQFWK